MGGLEVFFKKLRRGEEEKVVPPAKGQERQAVVEATRGHAGDATQSATKRRSVGPT